MRGCLSVLILAVGFLVAGTWLAGPAVAGFIVESGLSSAGFNGTNTSVKVTTDPPFEVITGHADQVEIDSDDATIDRFTAGNVQLGLTDANLLNRTFERVDGTLEDVTLEGSGDASLEADRVELRGDPSEADMTIRVTSEALGTAATELFRQQLGVDVDEVTFEAPDKVLFTAGSTTIAGQFVIHEGGLSMNVNLPGAQRIDLVEASRGFRLTNVGIDDDGMTLDGVLDVERLLS